LQVLSHPAGFFEPELIFFGRVDIGVVKITRHLITGLKESDHIKSIRGTA